MRWWETEDGRRRLAVEKTLMQKTYSETRLRLEGGKLFWLIRVPDVNGFGPHIIMVEYPQNNYPAYPPEASVLEPGLRGDKHQHSNGKLCLFNPKEGPDYGWDPGRSTAVTIALWAVEWIKAYYAWRKTGRWPGYEEEVD